MLTLMVGKIFYLLILMINGFVTFNSFARENLWNSNFKTFVRKKQRREKFSEQSFAATCARKENFNERKEIYESILYKLKRW